MNQKRINPEALKTIEHIGMRWEKPNKNILKHIFPLLAKGKPVSPLDISKVSGFSLSEVEEALNMGRTSRDQNGRVTELFGFMFDATSHRIEIEGNAFFSCCPLIALTVSGLIGKKMVLETVDPIGRKIVKLYLAPNGEISSDSKSAVASMVRTEADGILNHVAENFCSHIHLFISRENAEKFISEDARRYVVELNEFRAIAQELKRVVWGS